MSMSPGRVSKCELITHRIKHNIYIIKAGEFLGSVADVEDPAIAPQN